jgi:aryl-alcohol dehydrogenase-like predicted oxidoreductase
MADPGHVAVGTWSGGRYMHFGVALEEDRLAALLRPGDGIDTLLTADAYGAGEGDRLAGRAIAGVKRDELCLVGAIGHDFYEGQREGAKGYPRFTDPRLRAEQAYGDYVHMAVERSLERCGVDHFDLLLLHNPDATGYRSEAVWSALAAVRDAGLTTRLGVAPGPANGFTLDLIDCFERFGALIDWAMVILNPLEPWPGELCMAAAQRHDVGLITRVVDYGGLLWDDVSPGHAFVERDHRLFRPEGWVEAGLARMEGMRPIAQRHGLTMLQLACQWNLAHGPVACTVPTLIQEPGEQELAVESKRAELVGVPREVVLSDEEVAEIRRLGDNTGSMALKGATPDHEGAPQADRWAVGEELAAVGARWGIDPFSDLRRAA